MKKKLLWMISAVILSLAMTACGMSGETAGTPPVDKAEEHYENGRSFLYGTDGKEVDLLKASYYFERAEAAGKEEANFYLGLLYDWYGYPKRDYKEALLYYSLCDSPYAQIAKGFLYEYGVAGSKDKEKAEKLFQEAIDQGCVEGYYGKAVIARDEEDYETSWEYANKALEGTEPIYVSSAMSHIGFMYRNGRGVEQDYEKAVEWFEKAAALNNGTAMNNLGAMYRDGLGVETDYAKAMEWFEKAVVLNDDAAMNNIGSMYRDGLGVETDYAKAMKWYEKAVELNNSNAGNNIGYMYYAGLGVKQDYAKALEWYKKAAAVDNAAAMSNIAYMYYAGLGVEQNYEKAVEWFEKAAAYGDEDAKENAEYIKSIM